MKDRTHFFLLALLLATYLALSLASSFSTKLGYGPDEAAHFIYVRQLGEHFQMPVLAHEVTTDISGDASHEAHQPPFYYILSAIPYFIARSIGAGVTTGWWVVRIFTCLIGMAWVFFLYKLYEEFYGCRRFAALFGAACLALIPTATYMGGVVNNDMLIAALFTAGLWIMVRCIRTQRLDRQTAYTLGLIGGFAVFTKAQGLFLPLLMILTTLLIARRQGWKDCRDIWANTGIAVAMSVLISSGWFISNKMIFGSGLISPFYQPKLGTGLSTMWIVTEQFFAYFWAPFWIVREFVSRANYLGALTALCAVILVGISVHAYRCRRPESSDPDCRFDAWLLLIIPVALSYALLLYQAMYVDSGLLQQGRLFLPSAAVLGAAIISGSGALVRSYRLRVVLAIPCLLIILALNLRVLYFIKFYSILY